MTMSFAPMHDATDTTTIGTTTTAAIPMLLHQLSTCATTTPSANAEPHLAARNGIAAALSLPRRRLVALMFRTRFLEIGPVETPIR